MKRISLWFLFAWFNLIIIFTACSQDEPEKLNVLFIAVDDLRPELNCYGNSPVISPNIDRIAEDGFIFQRAYCNIPVSGASRASLMTGLRPTSEKFRLWHTRADEHAPGYTTLPQHFKNNGYSTISFGKIYHHGDDDLKAWDKRWRFDGEHKYFLPENVEIHKQNQKFQNEREDNISGPAYESADVDERFYPDAVLTDSSIAALESFKENGKPFFLAVGYVRPHLPFNAPRKYWDLYDSSKIELAKNSFKPQNAPEEAIHTWPELRDYHNIPVKGPLPNETAKKLIHGYYASTSFVDAQIGRLINHLKKSGLDKNTIIVLWGDHGWQLGEHGLWCKHANFETSLRTSLIVYTPQIKGGKRINSLTEFVDIYPSLCELTNLQKPEHLEGDSFVSLLKGQNTKWKDAVYPRYLDGESVRTDRYLYTEWYDEKGNITARMLYDHQKDPDENINIAEIQANAEIVNKLSGLIKKNISNRILEKK